MAVNALLLSALLLAPAVARPACDCFCVDGAPRTLCTSVAEAAAGVDRCAGRAPGSCPAGVELDGRQQYAAPVEGAANCRDVGVFDPSVGSHRPIRVCDAVPADRP
jgi:hypothetical protein